MILRLHAKGGNNFTEWASTDLLGGAGDEKCKISLSTPLPEVPRELDYLDMLHIINVYLSNCAFSGTESYEISWKLTGRPRGMSTGFLTSLDRMYFLDRSTST